MAEVAPPLLVSQWFNTVTPITLDALRGKVVLIEVFQMLCPACVMHSIPQAMRIWQQARASEQDDVVVLGLHSVFEHHQVMTPEALAVYLHEFRIPFPVGVDAPGARSPIPETMRAYGMQGTPTALYIDREGKLVRQHFGAESDETVMSRIEMMCA